MAYNKTTALIYAYYEIASSYFKSYKVTSYFAEKQALSHFKEANNDMQYSLEDFCIYSIENILPKLLGEDIKIENLDVKISIKPLEEKVILDTEAFYIEANIKYSKGKPFINYSNLKKK